MKTKLILILLTLLVFVVITEQVYAHQSGCHRWHSCPSDTGSYVCGDLGYYSQCPRSYSESQVTQEPEQSQLNAPQSTEKSEITETFSSTITVTGTEFSPSYLIVGGKITEMIPDPEISSLIINVDAINDGELTIKLSRDLIDAKIVDEDDDFFVLTDGREADFDEVKSVTHRTLTIPFSSGTEQIEIIGTFIVPEFGSITTLILVLSIVSIITISAKTRLNIRN